jgi:hypothetical protein
MAHQKGLPHRHHPRLEEQVISLSLSLSLSLARPLPELQWCLWCLLWCLLAWFVGLSAYQNGTNSTSSTTTTSSSSSGRQLTQRLGRTDSSVAGGPDKGRSRVGPIERPSRVRDGIARLKLGRPCSVGRLEPPRRGRPRVLRARQLRRLGEPHRRRGWATAGGHG